jgi:predicted transcriptional regulator
MNTKVLTAHVPFDLAQKVDRFAEQMDRSKGWVVKQALQQWIDREELAIKLTQEALDDVDHGRVVDHQEIQSWVASLEKTTK